MPHYRSFGPETRPYPPFQLNTLLPVVGLGFLSYGLLGFASQREQLLPLLHQLSNPIMLGLLVVLLSYAMRFGRWRLLLGSLHEPPPLAADSRIWMGSFAFTATPGKTGESVRALLLHQECGIPAALTLVALVVERVTDALAVLLIVLINLPLMLRLGMAVTFPLSLALLVLAAGWWLAQRATMRIQVRTMIHHLLRGRHATAGDQGLAALRQLLRPPLLLQATLIGTVAWSLEGFALWLLLRGMGIGNATLGGATIAHTGAGLIGAISLLPGGLGTTEASTVGLLVIQGIGLAAASSATLLIRLMTLWFATALGVLCLLSSKR